MTADPWALLREARKLIHTTLDINALRVWACESDGDELALDDLMYSLRGRIDAALAAHRDEVPAQDSAKDVVESVEMKWEWHSVNSPNRVEAILTDGTRVTCRKANYNGVMGWAWDAEIRPVGFALTLDEAKSSAIAAARGMR